MPDALHPSIDPIYRANPAGLEIRADSETGATTLHGHFCRFGAWNEIDSFYEGRFLERVEKGAFAKTIAEHNSRAKTSSRAVVCSFDHGFDPTVGDKPLGPIDVLREDNEGPYYEVPLYDTDYNRDFLAPVLQGRTIDGRTFGSGLGASYRFRVVKEEWNDEPGTSADNPEGLPERTIKEVRLYEFGPVVYPADPGASAGVRSLTDHYVERARQRTGTTTDRGAAQSTPERDEPQPHSDASPTNPTPAGITARAALLRKEAIHVH